MNSKTHKGFIIPIVIIISLLILGVVAYIFSPNSISLILPTNLPETSILPTSVSNFSTERKIYTDTNHFVEFKYPENYKESKLKVENNTKYLVIGCGLDTGLIEIRSEMSNLSPKDWWQRQPENLSYMNSVVFYKESMFKDQKSVEVNFDESSELADEKFILLKVNGRNYSILLNHLNQNCFDENVCWEKYLEDQILSTFKFIK